MQAVQLHLGPNQLLICVLNFPYDVSLFNSTGNMFQMWGPKTLTLLSPNVTEFSNSYFKVIFVLCIFWNLHFSQTNFACKQDLIYWRSGKPQVLIPIIAELPPGICLIYLKVHNTDLKMSLYVWVHLKTIPWKFRILNTKNSLVIYPWSLYFPQKVGYFLTYFIVSVCL